MVFYFAQMLLNPASMLLQQLQACRDDVLALAVENGVIREARLGLGGVATVPWRLHTAEHILRGAHPDVEIFRTAAAVALAEATPFRDNAFKVELAKCTIVRALLTMLEAES